MKKITKSLIAGAALIPGMFAFTACGGEGQFSQQNLDTSGSYEETTLDDFKGFAQEISATDADEEVKGLAKYAGFKFSIDADLDLNVSGNSGLAGMLGSASVTGAASIKGKESAVVVAGLDDKNKLGLAAKITHTEDGATSALEAYIPYEDYIYFGGKTNYGGQTMDVKYKMDFSKYMDKINEGIQKMISADYDNIFDTISTEFDFGVDFNMSTILADFTISKSVSGSVTKYKFTSEKGLEYEGVKFENPVIYLIFNNGDFAGIAVQGTLNLDIKDKGVTTINGTATFKASLAPFANAISFPNFADYQDIGYMLGGNDFNYDIYGHADYSDYVNF